MKRKIKNLGNPLNTPKLDLSVLVYGVIIVLVVAFLHAIDVIK